MENQIVLFTDGALSLDVKISPDQDTVWLSANQMAKLFDKDEKTVRKHINNIFSDDELERENNTQKMRVVGVKQPVPFYSLDVIISVGYRVKSKRGIAFRRWANSVLKQYILQGYAVNHNRMQQLNEVIQIMKRTENSLDSKQILNVIEQYTVALDMLDDYDHQCLKKPEGSQAVYVLKYEECRKLIAQMRFGAESDLFGKEKDDSFKGSIGNIYQFFGEIEIYPSLEEKAANLLYFVTKNHSFWDGNKRIAAAVFLYFLEKNNILFKENEKRLSDHTLVALIIMIAESKPEEKETMVKLIMNFLVG